MATPEQALADLKTALSDQDLAVRTEVVRRITRELEEQRADNKRQRIESELAAAKAQASYPDLRLNDVRGLLNELQEAAGQPPTT